MTDKGKKKYSI